MSEVNELDVEPVKIEAHGITYFVPSTFEHYNSAKTEEGYVEYYRHNTGLELKVERIYWTSGPENPPSPLQFLKEVNAEVLAENLQGDHQGFFQNPVMLRTGFAFVSMEIPKEDDGKFVTLYCNLCAAPSPRKMIHIRFSSVIHRNDFEHPAVYHYRHLMKQYARKTIMAENP
ncbi:MAG: hypothetical protein WCO97_10665 [bacterium]